jgi:hypothetical protein
MGNQWKTTGGVEIFRGATLTTLSDKIFDCESDAYQLPKNVDKNDNRNGKKNEVRTREQVELGLTQEGMRDS